MDRESRHLTRGHNISTASHVSISMFASLLFLLTVGYRLF